MSESETPSFGEQADEQEIEDRLAVACALAHALLDRSTDDAPVAATELARRRGEAQALFETSALPTAVFAPETTTPRLINAAWRGLFGPRVPAGLLPAFAGAAKGSRHGAILHVAELALERDAHPAYCAATLRPIGDGFGAMLGMIIVCVDITDAIFARQLAVGGDALVWSGPAGGGSNYFNQRWRTYTGDPIPSAWQLGIHGGDLVRCNEAFDEAARGRAAIHLEARLRRGDGEYRWHRIGFTVAGSRWFGTAIDIDDAHNVEAERSELLSRERAARAAAEEASRLKDQFLATVSHELRAPMTTMLLWEKVLREETADAALRARALEVIHQSALTQSRLVGDLLDVSRAISGKLYVDLRPVDIERVLCESIDAIAPAASAKQLALHRRSGAVGAEVQGDAARLRQILDNLLSNAVKFTPAHGQIVVTSTRKGRTVVIEVADTGRGIAADFLPRLFEPFSQTDDSLTRRAGGLGLGLTIAHQLVELHHGTLSAASGGPGRGATFTVTLPVSGPRRASSPPIGVPRTPALGGIRVLVIDDDPRVRDALALLLTRAGAVIETAGSAEAARAMIASSVPQALVCDIAMPGEDGYSFIQKLRASGIEVPAIALTAYAMEGDANRAQAAGFDRHLAKPIDFDSLVANLDELIGARGRGDAGVNRRH